MVSMMRRNVIAGVSLSFILWYFVFLSNLLWSFWIRVTLAALLLTGYAHRFGGIPLPEKKTTVREVALGLGSGVSLYALFYIGFNLFKPLVAGGASNVYLFRSELPLIVPAVLLLITSFCEEFFWRNYVQSNIVPTNERIKLILTSVLYALIHFPTYNAPLMAAAFIAGLFWGILYQRTRSIWLVTFSHIAWTELIFVFLPLS